MRQRCVVTDGHGGPGSAAASLHAWEAAVSTHLGRVSAPLRQHEVSRCEPEGGRGVSGYIEYADLDGAALCRLHAGPHRFSRSMRGSAFATDSPLMLGLQLHGRSHFEQAGRCGTLDPGDWCLLDTRLPFAWRSPSGGEQLVFMAPRPGDAALADLIERGRARPCDGRTGAGRMVQTLLGEAQRQVDRLSRRSARSLVDAVSALAWQALAERVDGTGAAPRRENVCDRLKGYIEARLGEPGLSVATVAAGCGLSARGVQRAFAADPAGSVSRHIWARRLDRCAAALRDPWDADRSITDIALSFGFSSSSHFSRAFRMAFGVAPRVYRTAAGDSL